MSVSNSLQCDNVYKHAVTTRGQYAADLSSRFWKTDSVEDHKSKKEMNSLQKQLKEEAENIVRWKASSEIKAKNLERQLQETRSIIEDQRHNMMDLQLHSEHLSQSLLKEHQERELVNAKVTHTRQLFLALQDQYQRLLNSTKLFQKDKDFLTSEHGEIITKLTNLQELFKTCQDTAKQFRVKAQEDLCHLDKQKEALEKQISGKDREIASLTEKLMHDQDIVKDLSEKLRVTEDSFTDVQNEKNILGSQLDEVKASLIKAQDEHEEQKKSLSNHATKAEKELEYAQIRLKESQNEFQEAVEKIQYLKKNNDILEGAKSELTERVAALNKRKQELLEEVAYKAEVMQSQESAQNTLLLEFRQLQQSNADISTQLNDLQTECRELEVEKEHLLKELKICKENLAEEQKLGKQLEEQVTSLKAVVELLEQLQDDLKKEQKIEKEHTQELEDCVKELREKVLVQDEQILTQERKLSSAEENAVTLEQKVTDLENTLGMTSDELKVKKKDCEDLAESVKQLKTHTKNLCKELKSKTKNSLSDNKMKKKLEKKIAGLEHQLRSSTELSQSLESKLKAQEELLSTVQNTSIAQEEQLEESLKSLQEIKLSYDESLSEQQKLQEKLDAKTEELETRENVLNNNLEELKNAIDQKDEELNDSVSSHLMELQKLKDELKETKELNDSASHHEKELEDHIESLKKELAQMKSAHKEETEILKTEMESVLLEQKQAKEEANVAIKESVQTKLESDGKVKEMVDLLNRYKNGKETKLKEVEEQLQNSHAQIKQLKLEKEDLMKEINLKSDEKKMKVVNLQEDLMKEINLKSDEKKMKVVNLQNESEETPELKVSEVMFKTPSPAEYLQSTKTFAEPQAPKASCVTKIAVTNPPLQMPQQVSGILKTGRRTLLPPEQQKHVLFMTPGVSETQSGESSSDAYTFEVADSDDPFEEIKRTGRYLPSVRSGRIPRANIAPMIRTTDGSNHLVIQQPSIIEQHSNNLVVRGQKNKWQRGMSHERKKAKLDHQRQNIKTYSTISPKQKETMKSTQSIPSLTSPC